MAKSKKFPEGRVPPYSDDAEAAILGSMLLDKDTIGVAVESLRKECFYSDAHAKIFDAIVKIYDKNVVVDLITLSDYLRSNGKIETAGGASYLSKLLNYVPTSANVKHYIQIVKEKAILRDLIRTSGGIIEDCYSQPEEISKVLDRAERNIFEIAESSLVSKTETIHQTVNDVLENLERARQNKSAVTGVASGFSDLDKKTAGFHNCDFIVLAARPSIGKTSLAINCIDNIAVEGKIPTGFFSLEMNKISIVQRLICAHSSVNYHHVTTGYIDKKDSRKLLMAAGKVSESPLYIDDSTNLNVLELRARARRWKKQYGVKILFVDYLQLMTSGSRVESRQLEVTEISRGLKALAGELGIPIVVLSQLNRGPETRSKGGESHRPRLSDLRESGAIEQDADVVLMLHRPGIFDKEEVDKPVVEADLIIAKQRNGPQGTIELVFNKDSMNFVPKSIYAEEAPAESEYS